MTQTAERIKTIYQRLYDHFGPQHWWPADSPFEVMVGAVLTQNTNWENVRRAIDNLKSAGLLSFEALSSLPEEELARLIRPAGYYNIKARRLANLLAMVRDRFDADPDLLIKTPASTLRRTLLEVRGIGPETADSIVLYAAGAAVFVVDSYTHRIFARHGLLSEDACYDEIQETFTDALPHDAALFNEYHALIVRLGKDFCRKTTPRCAGCPIEGL